MINDTISQALQRQLSHERYNNAFYQALAAALETVHWPGFARWFRVQASEENGHAGKVETYLIDQSQIPQYDVLPAVMIETDPLRAFEMALSVERTTTEAIHKLYHLAEQEEDPATCVFLHWFIQEQVQEERALVDILQEMRRATCPAALLILDREYGKRA